MTTALFATFRLTGLERSANDDFPVTRAELAQELARMRTEPVALTRPVVVLAGWRSPWLQTTGLARRLGRLTGARAEDVLAVSYSFCDDIEKAAAKAVKRVAARWPSGESRWTSEVDVVGVSMGGLVARAAWAGMFGARTDLPRLRVRRLFTLGTPHRGAILANLVAPDRAARAMTPGSPWLAALDEKTRGADYELLPYARTRDGWVGALHASPPSMDPIWVAGPLWLSHFTIPLDDRLTADIARRLRGESPLARRASRPPRE